MQGEPHPVVLRIYFCSVYRDDTENWSEDLMDIWGANSDLPYAKQAHNIPAEVPLQLPEEVAMEKDVSIEKFGKYYI